MPGSGGQNQSRTGRGSPANISRRRHRPGTGDDMAGNNTCRGTKTVVESRPPTIVNHRSTFNLQEASSRRRLMRSARLPPRALRHYVTFTSSLIMVSMFSLGHFNVPVSRFPSCPRRILDTNKLIISC